MAKKEQPDLWKGVKHFSRDEWKDDPSKAAPELVLLMDKIRGFAGQPIIIHVCWAKDGHSEKSYHYTGAAVDFHFESGTEPISYWREFVMLSRFRDLGGIGFYPHWEPRPGWHVDIRNAFRRRYWVRKKNGEYRYDDEAIVKHLEWAQKERRG